MKFKLSTTQQLHRLKSEITKKYEELGFSFVLTKNGNYKISGNPTIYLETLDDLINFQKEFGELIICDNNEIEIYDGYRE